MTMKSVLCVIALACLAQAQELPQIDPAMAVDVNVTSVEWHPYSSALMYTKSEPQGKAIGLFAWGNREGQVVARVGEKDRVQTHWFANQPMLAVTVYHDTVRADVPYIEATIYLADGQSGQVSKLWAEAVPAKQGINIKVDSSPRYPHAIFTMKVGSEKRHFVLPNVGKHLIAARELDRAVAEGFAGPSWSVDGTAVYAKGLDYKLSGLTFKLSDSLNTTQAATVLAEKTSRLNVTFALATEDLENSINRLWVARAAPEAGAAVLELMPANAVLRQVRFKGAWQYPRGLTDPLALLTRQSTIQLGQDQSLANSLWLVRAKDDKKSRGALIAAHADKGWLAPWNVGVAYMIDGALFVRSFQRAP
jgi:hypothetical protein